MTTSSPALHTASSVEIMVSVEPQQTVISRSGSTCDALPHLHLPGDGVAQVLRSPGDGVLIDVGGNGFLRRAFDLGRGRKIGKALGQVDGAVQHGLARHLANDGFGEVRNSAR